MIKLIKKLFYNLKSLLDNDNIISRLPADSFAFKDDAEKASLSSDIQKTKLSASNTSMLVYILFFQLFALLGLVMYILFRTIF